MKISIHQPNFCPWIPFFRKIEWADIFVILTHCQFEKNNFQNRWDMNDHWYTMSTNKGLEPIKDKIYLAPQKDWAKIKAKLPKYQEILSKFDECICDSLADTNIAIIKKACTLLNIKTQIVVDYPTELISTDRLVDICQHFGAKSYLSGSSGKTYLDANKFKNVGIDLQFQHTETADKITLVEYLYGSCNLK